MPTTLELCEVYYGTKDIYKLMGVNKDSLEKDIKKAYYKLSLQVHPDRVPEDCKNIATEKFKVLTKIHAALTDKDKKRLYDEQGIIDEDNDSDLSNNAWLEMWRQFFVPITVSDIENYQKEYKNSEIEKNDIKKAYLNGKGCINYMMNCVPFMAVEDEPRIIDMVKEWIRAGDVPEYKMFTEEPKPKRNRRHKKYAKEALEAKDLQRQMEDKNGTNSLEQQMMKRNAERASAADDFFDRLLDKYGDADDSQEYVMPRQKTKKKTKKAASTGKTPVQSVKRGRVTKNKKE